MTTRKISEKIIAKVRSLTPDWIRWNVGPYVAYGAYIFRIYILGNKDAPKVLSLHDTIDLVVKENLSVIRFGDGEMSIMGKNDLGFQKADESLSKRLKEIIQLNVKGLLICVPGMFGKLDDFAGVAFWFSLHHQFRYRQQWLDLLNTEQVYGDTLITRPYLGYKTELRKKSGEVFHKLFSIWRGKNVVLIEGSKSRLGVGNDMFKEVASLARILAPAENAYSRYNEIKQAALKQSKDKLMLLSLGPAAKVLAYDLFCAGYRVIDVGHIDMEYEMYIRKEPIEAKVRYKYFNEIHERDPEDCTDPEYLSQITAVIQ
jgi:glycosyltransferase family protein